MAYELSFSALGDSTRYQIFEKLRDGPATVSALAQDLPVSRPAVSQHLKVLKEAGLVADQADGARRVYRIDWAGLNALRAHLDGFWAAEMQRQLEERLYS
jgi:DNA-binding transcriptional ArsR family regulator